MVYVNDRESKITKINLTDSTRNGAQLFDQTTLFKLNATRENHRFSFSWMLEWEYLLKTSGIGEEQEILIN